MRHWISRITVGSIVVTLVQILGVSAGAEQERLQVLLGFDRVPTQAEHDLVESAGGWIKYSHRLVPAIAATMPPSAITELLADPKITFIQIDRTIHAVDLAPLSDAATQEGQTFEAASELENSSGVQIVGAGAAHASGFTGAGVRVAVIDSGIDPSHPDLAGNYAGGWDFVNDDDDPFDDFGHGTQAAGILAAEANGSGVVGVSPGVDLYALKVLNGDGIGFFSDIIAALEWTVDNGIQVTNNSYVSMTDPGGLVRQAFDNAYAAGVLHIAAAGNGGTCAGTGDMVGFPARFASVIAVAATDAADLRACFSAMGPEVELAAPGVNIRSTLPWGAYGVDSGTSLASPHVAGVAALVMEAGVTGPQSVRNLLNQTALDLGAPGRDGDYGHGRVDARAAVAFAGGLPDDSPPMVTITSPGGSSVVSGTIGLSADAEDDFEVAQVRFIIDGSTVAIDTDGSDGWGSTWDTVAVSDGPHTLTAEATDTGRQITQDTLPIEIANSAVSIHVGDLDGKRRAIGSNRWRASVGIKVHDSNHKPVAGVLVIGSSDVGAGGELRCVTGKKGRCTVDIDRLEKPTTVTFAVVDLALPGYQYAPSKNHDRDGNSNGHWITLTKPR